jgi:hypothetical protein
MAIGLILIYPPKAHSLKTILFSTSPGHKKYFSLILLNKTNYLSALGTAIANFYELLNFAPLKNVAALGASGIVQYDVIELLGPNFNLSHVWKGVGLFQ